MVLEVSKAGRSGREMSPAYILSLMREPGFESSSAIGRGTSEASGAWPWRRSGRCGCGGLWSAVEGRRKAPWNSGRDRRCGRADGLTGLSRNGSPAQSGYDVRGSVCCPALTSRRSLWRTCSDTVCASRRNACLLAARKAFQC